MDMSCVDTKTEACCPEVIVLEMFYMFMKNYNYLVVDPATRLSVIIDPAWEMDKVDQALLHSDSELSGVLVTHSHADHINLAASISEKYKCPIWMSFEEIDYAGFYADRLVGIDTSSFMVGEMCIQPIYTPGHTPGCFCYLIGNNLFTGDVLFAEGCGMCSDTSAAYSMFSSLMMLKDKLPPDTKIYPGHSYGKVPGQLFSQILKENIYLQFKNKEDFSAYRLRKGQDKSKMLSFR